MAAATEPTVEHILTAEDGPAASWADARERLAKSSMYWVATEHPDGRPHVRPVLAVWVDGALHTTSSPTARKSKNLARNSQCVITASCDDLDLVVEGTATKVSEEAKLERVAEAYRSKYDWPVIVLDGGFDAEYAAPTAGKPPYEVYELTPTTAFGFPTTGAFGPTRWRF